MKQIINNDIWDTFVVNEDEWHGLGREALIFTDFWEFIHVQKNTSVPGKNRINDFYILVKLAKTRKEDLTHGGRWGKEIKKQ